MWCGSVRAPKASTRASAATAAMETASSTASVGTASAVLGKGGAWRTSESDHNHYRE